MAIRHKIKRSSTPDAMPIQEAFKEFITEKEAKNLSKATIKNYVQSFEYFMDFHGFDDESLLSEIKASHFYQWMNTLKLDGVRHTSINHYLRDNRVFFYWCMERTYIENSFQIPLVEGQEELPKMFSDEEIDLLLEKPKPGDSFTNWRTWAIVNWVLATGNRAATICEVRCSDVKYTKNGVKGEIVLGHTKNKKAQIVPLSSSLENVLKEYTRKFDVSTFLFPNIGDEQLTTNALSHSFARYCKERGCEHTNIHGLRHSFSKLFIKNGGTPFALQKLLGHATLEMTRHYVKLFSDDLKEDYESYSPLDTIKKGAKRTNKIKRN